MSELIKQIAGERTILRKQTDFFAGIEQRGYIGVLTNDRVDIVTSIYPSILYGMNLIYHHISEDSLDLTSEEGFLVRYLEKQYFEGNLISDEDVGNLRRSVQSGKYSLQYEAYVRYRRRMGDKPPNEQRDKKEQFGSYRPVRSEGDILYNKRMCLSRIIGIRSLLQALYGEVDYSRALVVEAVMNAPFLDTVVADDDSLDDDARKRHKAYFEDVITFANEFKPEERYATFEKLTEQFPAHWGEEVQTTTLSAFDRPFVEQIYGFAGSFLQGDIDLKKLYPLYRQTVVRRGKIFKATAVRTNAGTYLSLNPTEPSATNFGDIAGYDEQKGFYQNLITKTADRDPIVGDIRMVLATGEPGLGKSLGVQAFLNALPDNARGMIAKLNGVSTDEYQLLARLARMHPDLDIFAVIEDIDALAGDRLGNAHTRQFLELDSVYGDSVPNNFHLIATTNKPYVIDSAIIRPGRTAKILMYEAPDRASIRAIAELHAQKNGLELSEEIFNLIADKSEKLTPDEVRHIVWSLRFEGIDNPTEEDIDRFVKEIQTKHKS